ncbi:MAG TPA: GIY-YIG nuclease family protein, partial [Candidatus Babeliales bacterium]|nr:GIY-YIG nuclease family protein [Candidatus Babeliales bacterium]
MLRVRNKINTADFMSDFFVYILKCSDGSYYTGHTDDLEKRLSEHQNNFYPCYTSKKLPVKLVYSQSFDSRDDAFISERKIKNWSRCKKEALIRGDY